jgi:hypothetical protein
MHDPDLVRRAERAATALEQAWMHWRVRHGLGAGPPPPVSSYVGYSLEEPWGQPRVVLGVGADEAERLAAILEGQDFVGPVYAGVTARPEQDQPAALPGGPPGRTITESRLGIPAQLRPHAVRARADLATEPAVSPGSASQRGDRSAARPPDAAAHLKDPVIRPPEADVPATLVPGQPGIESLRPLPAGQDSPWPDEAPLAADGQPSWALPAIEMEADAVASGNLPASDGPAGKVPRARARPASKPGRARRSGGPGPDSPNWTGPAKPPEAAADTAV